MVCKLAINVCTRDRPSELALLLQSLRTQTEEEWDLFILEDNSGTPLQNYHFINCLLNRIKMEGHFVEIERTPFNYGVSKARQTLADKSKDYKYILRVDDDVILDPEFIEKLYEVLNAGYDMASGVTPTMTNPTFVRDPQALGKIIGRVIMDNEGNMIMNSDDCGMNYTDEWILPSHHFRSSLLYKSEIHNKVNYYPTRLSKHGFREEQLFSFKAICEGFTIGVNTRAIAWHLNTPSGGERFVDSQELIRFNEQIMKEETKKLVSQYGNFIEKYNKKLGLNLPEPGEELFKTTNLIL